MDGVNERSSQASSSRWGKSHILITGHGAGCLDGVIERRVREPGQVIQHILLHLWSDVSDITLSVGDHTQSSH